jgi:outer membrane protein assembly factor BamD (BamD/ComL family)
MKWLRTLILRTSILRISILLILMGSTVAFAAEHGRMIRESTIFLSPDAKSSKLAKIERGREIVVLDHSQDWIHVEAILTEPKQQDEDDDTDSDERQRIVTGWILDKGIVLQSTPDGDKILFGEASDSEDEASERNARNGAAQDALHLYYGVFDLFPQSQLAGEGLFRAADIRWQLDKADVMRLPSAKEQDPHLRNQINEDLMHQVLKKFPGTKWADMAAFRMIDNKLCGDWQGTAKCPEKESEIYEKYVADHPQSPRAAEALYDAAWRQAAMIGIFKGDEDMKKSDQAKARAIDIAQKVAMQYPQSDYASRAETLLFLVQHDVSTWGSDPD